MGTNGGSFLQRGATLGGEGRDIISRGVAERFDDLTRAACMRMSPDDWGCMPNKDDRMRWACMRTNRDDLVFGAFM